MSGNLACAGGAAAFAGNVGIVSDTGAVDVVAYVAVLTAHLDHLLCLISLPADLLLVGRSEAHEFRVLQRLPVAQALKPRDHGQEPCLNYRAEREPAEGLEEGGSVDPPPNSNSN